MYISIGTARRVRGDLGSENLNIAGIQRFFRDSDTDHFAREKSFVFGKSTSNQVRHGFYSKYFNLTLASYMF